MRNALQIRDIYTLKEERMVTAFFNQLSEKNKRAYAAIEATRIGFGGVTLVCHLFGCTRPTVHRGLIEFESLDSGLDSEASTSRIRKVGAGRKCIFEEHQNLEDYMDEILEDTIAGDPMNPDVVWTHLSASDIRDKLEDKGISISDNSVRLAVKKTIGKTKGAKKIRYRRVQ